MINVLNPHYAKCAPSAKVLGGRLLDNQYKESDGKLKDSLKDATNLVLTSDGWTNIRGDHIVNFVVKAPGKKPLFYKSIDTTGISQTALATADAICAVIEEIEPDKISAVITDNPNTMRASWVEIERRYPTIAAYGCSAHGVNLLIKDIVAIPAHKKTSIEASKIIQFINNHHVAHGRFLAKMKEAKVTHKLTSSVPTRWYTEHTSAAHLKQAKILLTRLVNEEWELLETIKPKESVDRAMNLIKSNAFWERLDVLIEDIQLPSMIIGEEIQTSWLFSCFLMFGFLFVGRLEADDAPLSLVYSCFGELYLSYEHKKNLQAMVKSRWDFMSTECTGISFMLTPNMLPMVFISTTIATTFLGK